MMRGKHKAAGGPSPIHGAMPEPMAEGTIPLDSRGRKRWATVSDSQLIQYAQDFMKEKGITGRKQLSKSGIGIYRILLKRNVLEKVGFEQIRRECRNWSSMTDSQLIQLAQDFMKENGITGRKQLHKADPGLCHTLRRRKLLRKVGLEQKQREYRDWSSMNDGQLAQHTRDFMKERGITGRGQLQKADQGLYAVLFKRKLLAKVGFERKHRDWSSMADEQLIQYAWDFMKEKGITGKKQLEEADPGLYRILRMKKLLAKVGFEQKQRECRGWSSMSDEQLIQYARDFMKENGITGKKQLDEADQGIYEILRLRNLLSIVFFGIEQAKKQILESELVSGLRKAADAMQEFGGERE